MSDAIRSQVGDVKHSDLPGMEALGREGESRLADEIPQLNESGKKDGQVIMIKNNDQVEAYQVSCLSIHVVSMLKLEVVSAQLHLATNWSGGRCHWLRTEAALRRERMGLCL
jgi:hypothetical protein